MFLDFKFDSRGVPYHIVHHILSIFSMKKNNTVILAIFRLLDVMTSYQKQTWMKAKVAFLLVEELVAKKGSNFSA